MKKVLIILILVSLSKLNAQSLDGFKRISKHYFTLNDTEGKLHEFRDEFKSNLVLFKDFKRFNACRKTQRFFNYFGGSLAGGIVVLGLVTYPGFISVFFIAGVAAGAPFVLIGNLTGGLRKVHLKNKLLKKMNLSEYGSQYDFDDNQLELKVTNNGIGLVYNF